MRATRALIHLQNLRHNIDAVRGKIGPSCRICLPVKANAYGHGAVDIARAAVDHGVEYLAVATVSEGAQLRDAGIDKPVLLLNQALPEELDGLVSNRLIPVAADRDYIAALSAAAARVDQDLALHLKVDTGMGRIGCAPEAALELARLIDQDPRLRFSGLCTHFPSADSLDPEDREFTRKQVGLITKLADTLRAEGISPGLVHAANSGGVVTSPESLLDMVRPGIALYGYEPVPEAPLGVRPVMELVTRIVFIKKVRAGQPVSYGRTWTAPHDTEIATLPVGYGDGYNRLLSGRGEVLVNGRRYPVVGRVCMDMCMIDLGPGSGIGLHDQAVLFGPDPAGWSAADIAARIGTIPYEVTCWISQRVPREVLP